ncbi:MAG: histidine triad nucleotide-binding protein [Bdellovibrio sp. CG_4_9_14_3_um_filter_39_7]|nr:MAG: histidine triad nucleotide-binding protein [Bdellovibrio sp. CG_4_9_14_3_um_filter_39_7]
MNDCLFCKIIKGEIPSSEVFSNENVYAFKDLHPMAKIHNLFIHREHSHDINAMSKTSPEQVVDVYKAILKWTQDEKLDSSGFRVVTNCGPDAGQTVFHTHFHVLAGEKLGLFGK